MFPLRPCHGTQRDRAVECQEPAVVGHGQREQINVRQLLRTMDAGRIDHHIVQDTHIVRPELVALVPGRRIHVDSGNIQRNVNAVNIGWTRGRRNRSVVQPEGGTAMSRITRSRPRRSLVAAGIIGLVGLAASAATYAENICPERGRLMVAAPERLEPKFRRPTGR